MNDDYRPYDWIGVLGGYAVGALFGFIARGAGYGVTVAWAVAITVGTLVTCAFALTFWVERRGKTGVAARRPERIARRLGELANTYARVNSVAWDVILGVIILLLVVLWLAG
jgi:hypothetical protein